MHDINKIHRNVSEFATQDDLEDCGESTYDIKMRVMPDCWFVLGR